MTEKQLNKMKVLVQRRQFVATTKFYVEEFAIPVLMLMIGLILFGIICSLLVG